jgi:hypothetical protein
MAKIVKIKMQAIITQPNGGVRIQRIAPPEYDSTKIKIIAMEASGDLAGVLSRNDGTIYRIGVVADGDLATFTASDDIVELTQLEAVALGNVWRPQVTKIFDEQKIIDILEKVSNSQALTLTELNAIDPDNAERGVGKSFTFTERLNATIEAVNNG